MKIPDHISESSEKIFKLKILIKFFDADPGSEIFLTLDLGPGSGMEKIRILDEHPGSAR